MAFYVSRTFGIALQLGSYQSHRRPSEHCRRTAGVAIVIFGDFNDDWGRVYRVIVAKLAHDGLSVHRGGTTRNTTMFSPTIVNSSF